MNKYYVQLKRIDKDGVESVVNTLGFAYGATSGLYLQNIDLNKYEYSIIKIKEIKKHERKGY